MGGDNLFFFFRGGGGGCISSCGGPICKILISHSKSKERSYELSNCSFLSPPPTLFTWLYPTGEEEVQRFNTRFTALLGRSLADIHAWLSVAERPDHSRFTRVQRATVLVTCVYLYMCVNAVWYGAFHTREELERNSWHDSFGWEEVVVALASTLMVVPFLFILSFIFKRSRCKVRSPDLFVLSIARDF